MEKSKLGISTALLAAIACLACLYGGYVVAALVVGYILIREESAWLKKFGVSLLALMLVFSLLSTVINLLPNLLNMLYTVVRIFGGSLYFSFVENVADLLGQVLSLAKTVVFVLLGVFALLGKVKKVPLLGGLVEKFMPAGE